MYIQAGLALVPNNAAFLAVRGDYLRRLQRPAESSTAYKEALRLQPSLADAYVGLGELNRKVH